jgi:hypothetical protein
MREPPDRLRHHSHPVRHQNLGLIPPDIRDRIAFRLQIEREALLEQYRAGIELLAHPVYRHPYRGDSFEQLVERM